MNTNFSVFRVFHSKSGNASVQDLMKRVLPKSNLHNMRSNILISKIKHDKQVAVSRRKKLGSIFMKFTSHPTIIIAVTSIILSSCPKTL